MRRESSAALEPGCCRICGGSSDRKWFLDMEMIEDFFGHVYYCNYCFDQMAKAVDYRELTDNQYATIKSENAHLTQLVGDYRDIFAKFHELGLDLFHLLDFMAAQKGHEQPSTAELSRTERLTESLDESRSVDVPKPTRDDSQLTLSI